MNKKIMPTPHYSSGKATRIEFFNLFSGSNFSYGVIASVAKQFMKAVKNRRWIAASGFALLAMTDSVSFVRRAKFFIKV